VRSGLVAANNNAVGPASSSAHLPQVETAGVCRPGPEGPDHLGDHVRAHRRVERVGVIGDGVGRVELVAVLAVDDLLRQRRKAGRVRQPEHINKPSLTEQPLDPGVPPDLGVVVADHVHHPAAMGPGEAPQCPEQSLILGAGDRRSHPVAGAGGILHAQHVEEVSGHHELDGSIVTVEILDQQRELRRRLEDVAAWRPSDVGVGEEHEERLVREVVPDDAIGGGIAQHTRPAAPAPFPSLVTIGIIPGGMQVHVWLGKDDVLAGECPRRGGVQDDGRAARSWMRSQASSPMRRPP
jgi:hypothetical protein